MAAPARFGVLFDVGYVLLDESARLAEALAWLAPYLAARGVAVTPERLHALYVRACRAPNRSEPSLLVQVARAAGASPELARAQRRDMPWGRLAPLTAYPGTRAALERLRAQGLRLGVLANQPANAADDLAREGLLPLLEGCWLSEAVGLAKPDPAFFRLALDAWGLPPARVAYVGDRPENDVGPSNDLGLLSVRLLQGPHAEQPARGPREVAAVTAPSLPEAVPALLAWASSAPA